METWNVYAVARKPLLCKEVPSDYELNNVLWEMKQFHEEQGGSPIIKGVVTLDITVSSKTIPRYKLEFPNGHIDYARLDTFDKFYTLEIQ